MPVLALPPLAKTGRLRYAWASVFNIHMGVAVGFLKNLFGGGDRQGRIDDAGVYVYVRLARSGEVVRLRLNPEHEFVPDPDQGGYTTHKTIVGPRSFNRADAVFHFDEQHGLVSADIDGGELADEAAWQAQQADVSGEAGDTADSQV